jgi:3-oxoadipate enol-lactonase
LTERRSPGAGGVAWAAGRRAFTVPPTTGLPEPRPLDLPGRGRTAFVDIGPRDAPPVILLHAVACTGLLTWYPSLHRLAERHRVVAFDQRWHGRGIRSPRFSLDDCAGDVLALADELGLDRFVLAGYSMGGLVAQLTARAAPERVRGLVLCSTGAGFQRGVRQRVALAVFGRAMRQLRHRARLGVVAESGPVAEPPRRLADQRWALAQFRSTSTWAVASAIDEIGRFDSTGWLHRLRMPASVVVTARDRFIAPDHQRWLARRLPNASSYEVRAGHAACVLRSDRFVPALLTACTSVLTRA